MTGADTVLLLGLGAQAKYVAEACGLTGARACGIVALEETPEHAEFAGLPVLGGFGALPEIWAAHGRPALVLCCADPARKERYAGRAASLGAQWATVVHPAARVAAGAAVGPGSILNACAVVQPDARLGSHVMLHATAVVEHDCVVEDFANLAPGAVLAGHARVGRGACVYTRAAVLPGVRVGRGAVVGAGAVVTRDVPDFGRVAGVPARPLPENASGDSHGH